MKPGARLRLAPRASRIGCAAVVGACVLASTLLAALPLPIPVIVPGAVVVLAVMVSGLWRCTGRGLPALLHVGIDRRLTVSGSDGRSQAGVILDDSYVGAWLTTIVWRPDGMPWWRPARAIVVLPDMLPHDEFRRLRVALRYGRSVGGDETSDDDAA